MRTLEMEGGQAGRQASAEIYATDGRIPNTFLIYIKKTKASQIVDDRATIHPAGRK